MAPTICSGKKRQTRTITTTNIRRHGQGAYQLNQALSNIANFVARGPLNSKVPASVRKQTHNQTVRNSDNSDNYRSTNNEAGLNYSHLTHTRDASALNHNRQQLSFMSSDNAVTSSTHSDTENSLDLRLAGSTAIYDSNSTDTSNDSSLLPSSLSTTTSLSSHKEKASSPSLQGQERFYQRCPTVMQANNLTGHERTDVSGSDETDSCDENDNKNNLNLNKKISEIHPSNKRKYYFSYNDVDSDEDDLESTRELNNSDMSYVSSDTDMETDESNSMTSLDTEKSAELKKVNHPLLRDKLLVKKLINNNSNTTAKSLNKTHNTNGLLSIAIKTIKLVKRNQLLQERLTQLQLETSEFIQSVLANPENRHFRETMKQKV